MATKKKSTVKPKPKAPPAPTKKSLAQKRSMEKAKEYRKRMTKIDEEQYTTPVIKKRLPNRVPPRIIKKVSPAAQQAAKDQNAVPEFVENTAAIDLAAKIALAKKQSITEEMPKSANDMIRLSRRPTTRDKGRAR